jgi:hypothetical protein
MKIDRQRHRPLEVSIGPADRDPMFNAHRRGPDGALTIAALWYGSHDTLTPPTAPVEVPGPQWDLAPLPPPDTQQNDHVMKYWNWRLDRMGAKRDG